MLMHTFLHCSWELCLRCYEESQIGTEFRKQFKIWKVPYAATTWKNPAGELDSQNVSMKDVITCSDSHSQWWFFSLTTEPENFSTCVFSVWCVSHFTLVTNYRLEGHFINNVRTTMQGFLRTVFFFFLPVLVSELLLFGFLVNKLM